MHRVGTRSSHLALTQTRKFMADLSAKFPEHDFEERHITTEGDLSDTPLSQSKTPGVFVSALRDALLKKEVDIIIHSMKDLPAEAYPGIVTACIPEREDIRDVLVSREGFELAEIPFGSLVGTSSPRRTASLRRIRPDLRVESIRGNIDTRLRKVSEGAFDATVLAHAGLRRINRTDAISQILPAELFIPAPGQGALSVECRAEDVELIEMLGTLTDSEVALIVSAEREVLLGINAGCATAIGATASFQNQTLILTAELAVEQTGEAELVTESISCTVSDIAKAKALGRLVATKLLLSPIAKKVSFK
jgi:hydroxymethylbilane synthase